MSLWLVRAGRHGEQEQGALDSSVVTIGWNELPDLSGMKTKSELTRLYMQIHPMAKKNQVANEVGQVWRFAREIQVGDLVALPLKTQAAIAIGRVEGSYEYRELADNIKHIRRVKWLKTMRRSAFDQDILYSLGAFMTVCRIKRHDAENRVVRLLESEEQPEAEEPAEVITEETVDIEESARDQITKYIGARFRGHDFARLVEAILHAQGFITRRSSPGPDGGIDILAASGPLGFSKPWLCVQVKSSSSQVDVRVLRELQGVMSRVRAGQGLLVAWGGFNGACVKEASDAFFAIRLWDQGTLLGEVFKYYERFDDALKAELPLKKIWALVMG